MSIATKPVLLVACGLGSEARIARGGTAVETLEVFAGGGDAGGLRRALHAAAPKARGIISFGIAGGLVPGLRAGDVRVAREVIASDGERFEAHPAWASALVAALGCSPPAAFACTDRVVTSVEAKAALRLETGAELVDMESGIAAGIAIDRGLPFAALRVVIDAAERRLPPAVEVSMKPGGGLDLPAILRSVAKEPGQIPELIRTGRDSRQAFAALLRCRQLLGPGFAFLDLG